MLNETFSVIFRHCANDDLIFCSVVHHLVVYIQLTLYQKNCNHFGHFGQENRADKSPILLDFFFSGYSTLKRYQLQCQHLPSYNFLTKIQTNILLPTI